MRLTVYKNQYGYSTLAKNGDDKMYVSVQFRRGTEPTGERTDINILDAFFSTYKDRNGTMKPKLVVMEYTEENNEYPESPVMAGDFENDLPF